MKPKTRERVSRRRIHEYKEVHVLDTSVIVAALKAMVSGKTDPALKYFAKVKSGKYLVFVTPIVYGESFFVVLRDSEPNMLAQALERLGELLTTENLQPFFPEGTAALSSYLSTVSGVETRCGTTDARIVVEGMLVQDFIKATAETGHLNCFLASMEEKQSTDQLKVRLIQALKD